MEGGYFFEVAARVARDHPEIAAIVEPEVYERGGSTYTDSVNVAGFTRKQHRNVLRDIENLISTCSDLSGSYFIERNQQHSSDSRISRYFDMSRDGLTML